ncbi:MAG: hypothetical protein FWD45_04840 [Coriobacteriia bacterium]|nr:hypothetical protein [Coriobacteriia bacterium]
MDTSSYLARLEALLEGLPPAERQYAIAYYTEYLMDADSEDVEAAIAALGSPESLAAQIRADVAMRDLSGSPRSSHSSANTSDRNTHASADNWQPAGTYAAPPPVNPGGNYNPAAQGANPGNYSGQTWQNPGPGSYPQANSAAPEKKSALGVIGVVLIAIFALPIGLPIAAAVIGLVVALFATVGSLIVAVLATGISLMVASVAAIVVGFILLFTSWPVGLFYLGGGLVLFGLALLFNLAMFHLLRVIFKGIAMLFNSIRKRLSRQPKEV